MDTITSIDDFDRWRSQLSHKTQHILFRGQSFTWPLLPSICRGVKASDIVHTEKLLIQEFKKSAGRCLHKKPDNDWDWLVVAQHHGLPTRLLDWTDSPYIALWFALDNASSNNSRPVVWVMTPLSEDFITRKELATARPFTGSRTKLFETSFKIPRVEAQRGCFALMKHINSSKSGFVPLEKNKHLKNRLSKVYIEPTSINQIRIALEARGINQSRVYPDIDQVAKEIKTRILGTITA